jgi:hypothetical protein
VEDSAVTEGDALALLSVTVAFALYRLDVLRARAGVIEAAIATLAAVQQAMVGTEEEPGWGSYYFKNRWTAARCVEVGKYYNGLIRDRKYEQVLVVPAEPLAALAATPVAGDLFSKETVYAANLGLWRVGVFNQLVGQQTSMIAAALPEIHDRRTRRSRRAALGAAIGAQAVMLHRDGVGEADEPDGWYYRLRTALTADLERLDGLRKWRHLYGALDLVATLAVVAAAATCILVFQGTSLTESPSKPAPTTTTTP